MHNAILGGYVQAKMHVHTAPFTVRTQTNRVIYLF